MILTQAAIGLLIRVEHAIGPWFSDDVRADVVYDFSRILAEEWEEFSGMFDSAEQRDLALQEWLDGKSPS